MIRVYRYRMTKHFKDFTAAPFNFDTLRKFVVFSSMTGPAPHIVRELSTETAMKIFSYNVPVLLLFRNSSAPDVRYYDTELADA